MRMDSERKLESEEKRKEVKKKDFNENERKSLIKDANIKKWLWMGGVGILLLLLSFPDIFTWGQKKSGSKDEKKETATELSEENEDSWENQYIRQMEEQLSELLGSVEGVGANRVMITLNSSKEEIVEKDKPYSQENDKQMENGSVTDDRARLEKGEETVFYELEDGTKKPYVIKVLEPQIAGIVVVCKGGGNPQIKQEIIEAVQVLFSVPAHKIVVMKMKSAEGK